MNGGRPITKVDTATEQKAIKKIYTCTKGAYLLVKFYTGMLAAIGFLELVRHKNKWEKEFENIEAEESIIDTTSWREETCQDLDRKGQLIIDIAKSHNGIFRIRIDGQVIEVSQPELKALFAATPESCF